MDLSTQPRSKVHLTNPMDRVNKEVKRVADFVGVVPNEADIVRVALTILLKLNDEWQLQHRYMHTGAMADPTPPPA